ncbi:MAG: glycosyltransferase family 39 protein [Myxococcota bacterium]|nr:hypothetical protein [bacterium]MDP7075056.1 glycosyltransferase family 39 protein [Myxococcota bacterium]MDP7432499.1 glycosyltransferase family 39 protein [Myxococcota bacterium]HJO24518.1 glycosyltransferase family 39 protein [Myxococcota bacterium]
MSVRRLAPLWPPVLIGAVFFALGLITLDSYGLTFDEPESTRASREAWAVLTGDQDQFSQIHAIPGYYLTLDLSREAFVRGMAMLSLDLDRVTAEHAFNLILATAGLVCTYLLAWEIGRSRRAAALAMIAMAVMPAVIAHSRNNPKDVVTLVTFPLTFLLLLRAVRKPGFLRTALAAVVLGISLNTRTFSVALIPLFTLLLFIRWPVLLGQRMGQLVVIGSVAAAIAILLWPWLWLDPSLDQITRAGKIIAGQFEEPFQVLYLGELQVWTELPWHFRLFHLLAGLPLSLLLLVLVPVLAGLLGKLRRSESRELVLTGALWTGVLLAGDLIAPARYDGMRHYLMVLVGLSLLIGAGGDWLVEWLEDRQPLGLDRRGANRTGWVLVGCLIALAGWECIRIHPYQSAYLNQIASAFGGEQIDEWVEVEYWGHALKEGSEWINEHTEPNAVVFVPIAAHVAEYYLDREIESPLTAEKFNDTSRPRYLMFITRRAMYQTLMRHAETRLTPAFEIKRQRGTLLRIYRNGAPLAESSRQTLRARSPST